MIRCRFTIPRLRGERVNNDYRPVNYPIRHPYWCTGESGLGYTLVAYADDLNYILTNWPDAMEIGVLESDCRGYKYTDRFQCPDWMHPEAMKVAHEKYAGYPVYGIDASFGYNAEGFRQAQIFMRGRVTEDDYAATVDHKLLIHEANSSMWYGNKPAIPITDDTPGISFVKDVKEAVQDAVYNYTGTQDIELVNGVTTAVLGVFTPGEGGYADYYVMDANGDPELEKLSYHDVVAQLFGQINT